MREALVLMHDIPAGFLRELENGEFQFIYKEGYQGPPISLMMPINQKEFHFEKFPPFFDGLLPEGEMLMALLKRHKLDEEDYLSQLLQTGHDLVGAVTVRELE